MFFINIKENIKIIIGEAAPQTQSVLDGIHRLQSPIFPPNLTSISSKLDEEIPTFPPKLDEHSPQT